MVSSRFMVVDGWVVGDCAVSKSIEAFIWARLFLGLFGMDTYEIYWWFAIGITVAAYNLAKYSAKNF